MTANTQNRIALVLGATGGIGGEAAMALARRGWRIRALQRKPAHAPAHLPDAEWIVGDAMSGDDVAAAARGASLIVHGVNPPGYRHWRGLALPMLDNTIAAAQAVNARIAFPGTVYNYGPDAFPLVGEAAPQSPRSRKGAIRVEMERRLEASGARVLILRGGDFFGPHAGNSWFSQGMVKPNAPLRAITYPGKRDAGHAWAYLPDFADAIARLVERESELARFETFHFAGHWFERGVEFAERARIAAGAPNAPIHGFPWTPLLALSPFVRLFREMAEMRYLWTTRVQLDNSKLVNFLGDEPHTDIDLALRTTLRALGVVAQSPSSSGPTSRLTSIPLPTESSTEAMPGLARTARR